MNREIRRRTRVVGTFPDGHSALMLVCARLRHVAGTQWGGKKYMSMKHIEMQEVFLPLAARNQITGYRQVLCANSFTSLAEQSLHKAGNLPLITQ